MLLSFGVVAFIVNVVVEVCCCCRRSLLSC